ncbi:MAG TPA: MMPL family transporter [Nocardioides sp.]|uniref:MMPL family transporter n=1 Tax=Nocardioides sp. TaxID=35761 RepID=UPI002E362489|nr:MMPL family transporter [Nocardioides sp.]HEX5088547.1 MMPL family transporter [Nocardioides sp.]
MSTFLFHLGRSAARHPWRVVALWLVAAIAALFVNSAVGGDSDDTFRLPGAESQRGADLIEERFPEQSLYTSNVVLHDDRGLTDPGRRQDIEHAVAVLGAGAHVVSVADPFATNTSGVSQDGTTALVTIAYDQEVVSDAMVRSADDAVAELRQSGVQVEYDGSLGYATAREGGGDNGEVLGVLAAVIVLAVAFGSLVALSLPIGVTLLAILIGTSTLGVLAGFLPVPQIANVIGLMLGLGVGIDYALFILSRHRQNLDAGLPVPEAVGRANATAGLSVLFAGVTVVLAIAGVQVSGIPMLAMMGWGAAVMVAVTMLAALTLLPALLGILRTSVNSLRIPLTGRRRAGASLSERWAGRVVARPRTYTVAAALLLVAMAVPALSMRLAFPDAGNDPQQSTTRRAYDLVADAYGAGTNGQLLIVLESRAGELPAGVAERAADGVAAEAGVAAVGEPVVNPAGDLAVIAVTPTTAPQDEETAELLDRLRRDRLPGLSEDGAVTAHVTGGTALTVDVSRRLQDRMPVFLLVVIGLSFVLLTVVFRSVLVPLKAAVLNLLSIGAAYGVVVAVFQWGWAAGLIGVEEAMPIMPLAPMLMFAILFGLSMDYEVFLLSRVREQFVQHGDARRAVVEGVGATGRVITSAAVIMIAVFASFILAADPTTKLFGVGLAVAVLLDVTVGRMVLVPAVMSLLAERAWWLPRWLERRVPSVDLEPDVFEPDVLDPAALTGETRLEHVH